MANWQGNQFIPSFSQFSTLQGEIDTLQSEIDNIPREIITSTIFVSSIFISSMGQFNDLSGVNISVSSLITTNISSLIGDVTFLSLSSLSFNPTFSSLIGTFNPKIDLGMGGFLGGLLGSLGSGGLSVGLAAGGLATGLTALTLPRGSKQINNSHFETINGTTQLQVSTLGFVDPLYSTIFRTVSSLKADEIPGAEMFISTFFLPGTTCIRSISDPLDLPVDIYNGSTIQSFGQWVPLEISTGGGSFTPTPTFSNVVITYQDEPALGVVKSRTVDYSIGFSTLPLGVVIPNLTLFSSFNTHYQAISDYNLLQTTFSTGDISANFTDSLGTFNNFQIQSGVYDTFLISEVADVSAGESQLGGLNFVASTIGFGVSTFQTLTGTAPIQFNLDTQFNCNVILNNLSTVNFTVGNNITVGNTLFGQNAFFSGEIQASSLNILQTISTILTDTDLLNVSSLNADFISCGVANFSTLTIDKFNLLNVTSLNSDFISCGTATFSTLTIDKTVFNEIEGSNIQVDDVLRFKDPTIAGNVQYDFLMDYTGALATSNLLLSYVSSPTSAPGFTNLNVLSINGQNNFVGIGKSTPNSALDVVGNIQATGNLFVNNINANSATLSNLNVIGQANIITQYTGTGIQNVLNNFRTTVLPLATVNVNLVANNGPSFQWNMFQDFTQWTSTIVSVQAIISGTNIVSFPTLQNSQVDIQNNTSFGLQVNGIQPNGLFGQIISPLNFPSGARYRVTISPSGYTALSNPPVQNISYTNNLQLQSDQQNYYISEVGSTFPNNGLYIETPLYINDIRSFGSRARLIDTGASINNIRFVNAGFVPFQFNSSAGLGGNPVSGEVTTTITVALTPPGGTLPSTFAFHSDDWQPIVQRLSEAIGGTAAPAFNQLQVFPQIGGSPTPFWQIFQRVQTNIIGGNINFTVSGYMFPKTFGSLTFL